MKKGFLFALSLLASLPACCPWKKKSAKKEKTEQHIDTLSQVTVPYLEEQPYATKDENERVLSFFDEDLEEFTQLNDDYVDSSSYNIKDTADTDMFSWVDAQIEDEFKAVYFDFNRHNVRADQADAIRQNIKQLKHVLTEADGDVTVVGHTDQEGTPAYNIQLSESRARAVADMLIAGGIPQEKIKVVGRGQECPVIINGKVVDGTREERWPNRRTEIHVIYT